MKTKVDHVFSFDAVEHKYYLDGDVMPSFTEIVKENGLIDLSHAKPAILERNRQFGSNLHTAIKLYNQNNLNLEKLDPALKSSLDMWKEFLDKSGYVPVVEWCEQPIFSLLHKFGCTPDVPLKKNGYYAIAELKSSTATQAYMKLQTAAQKIAMQEFYGIRIRERFCLRFILGQELPILDTNKDARDESLFLSALNMYRLRKEEGLCLIK